jgi:hypothetical protein
LRATEVGDAAAVHGVRMFTPESGEKKDHLVLGALSEVDALKFIAAAKTGDATRRAMSGNTGVHAGDQW